MEGVVMRDIHPFTAPHNERAADSGNTATPMPLAIAAVSVAIDSISGNDSNLLIVFYVQIMPDDFVMQLHRF